MYRFLVGTLMYLSETARLDMFGSVGRRSCLGGIEVPRKNALHKGSSKLEEFLIWLALISLSSDPREERNIACAFGRELGQLLSYELVSRKSRVFNLV